MRLLREVTDHFSALTLVDESAFSLIIEDMKKKTAAMEKHEASSKTLKHLAHVEDMVLFGGEHGLDQALGVLGRTHDVLSGKPAKGISLKTKFDGNPSVVWGHDPKTGKFFVSTKSFFNKTPKINYTEKDVDTNHGASPGLAKTLKFLLHHLKKSTPKKGVYQGDLMYTSDAVSHDKGKLSFTPNMLTYNVDKGSSEGQKIMKSKVGIVPHTHYEEGPNGDLHAVYHIDMSDFKPNNDVHFMSSNLRGPFDYKSKDIKAYSDGVNNAIQLASKMRKNKEFGATANHEKLMMMYINDSVRMRHEPSAAGYMSFLNQRGQKPEHKTAVAKELQNVAANKSAFNNVFKLHKHVQNAKNVLVNVLSKNSPYGETIHGEKSKPEGFVATVNGQPSKLVDRQTFSAANFEWNQKVNPEDKPLVLSWGRMNPPTAGHGKMIEKGAAIAKRSGAAHKVVATRTQDNKDNPLTPQQKISFLKSMFPGTDTAIASEEMPTIIAQLQHYHNNGVRDVTIVAGADRLKTYQDILSKYNGEGPGKLFNFRRSRVISAGNRDANSSDAVESMSGSKMRDAAKKGDYETFKKGFTQHVKPKQGQEMFHDLRAQLGAAKIDQHTPNHVLHHYSKRDEKDKIGDSSRKEIDRRKRIGTWKET